MADAKEETLELLRIPCGMVLKQVEDICKMFYWKEHWTKEMQILVENDNN